jgi:hypothetical protein
MAKQRIAQFQIEWDIKKGKGEAFFVTFANEDEDQTAIHRVTDIDDDSFEVIQHLVGSGDALYFDPDTDVIGTGLITVNNYDEDEEDFDDVFEMDEDEDDEEEDEDEEEAESDGEEESTEKPA